MELQPGSSRPKRVAWWCLGAAPLLLAPASPHPQPPMREVLPTSAAGRHICNGLQAGPGSGSSQMWIPLECAFSLIVQPLKGPGLPLHPPLPLLHPSERAEAFLLSHSLWRNSHSRDQGQPSGGPHDPPAWSVGLGIWRSQPIHPPFSWGQALGGRGRNSGKLTRGERIWLRSAGSRNPWPFLGMPLTSPAPLMERTGLLWARPDPQWLPHDSLIGQKWLSWVPTSIFMPQELQYTLPPSGGMGSGLSSFR
jgi:hypothetical protein